MLSVAKLTLGQEAYYEQQVAGGLDDYYAGRGESPGIWAGTEAKQLGLVGVVGDGDPRHAAARREPGERGEATDAGPRAHDYRPHARPRER